MFTVKIWLKLMHKNLITVPGGEGGGGIGDPKKSASDSPLPISGWGESCTWDTIQVFLFLFIKVTRPVTIE